jgi:hypothetical protein
MLAVALGLAATAQAGAFALGASGRLGAADDPTHGRLPLAVRMGLSASLVAVALAIYGVAPSSYSGWILAGMGMSFVGDLVMAKLIPVPNRLLGGMAAFAVAHGCYLAGYFGTIQDYGVIADGQVLWLPLIGYAAVGVVGWATAVRNPERPQALNLGALVYGLWIGVMAAVALTLALTVGAGAWLAALGGVSFVLSDFVIGYTEIGGQPLRRANDWVWLTYVAGQMGIIYAGAGLP